MLRENLDPPAGDDECSVVDTHRLYEAAEDGIKREKVSERVDVGDVVHSDDLKLGISLDRRAKDRTADPAEAVDPDTVDMGSPR
jgi:hypothetical protein